MPPLVFDIFGFFGFLFSGLGFLIFGFGVTKFIYDAYEKAPWQVQIALVLGFFGMVIGIANFTSPGSTGMFVFGAGIAILTANRSTKENDNEVEEGEKKK